MLDEVDVAITTKNNEDTIEKCIKSIKKYVPYNKIIVLDDSDDKTPQIAEDLGATVYWTPALLGEKRYLQAKFTETDWIASIDSDVFVFPKWWEKLSGEIEPEVGVVNGFLSSNLENVFPAYERYTKFNSLRNFTKTGMRNTMANNLIRRDLLLALKDDLKDVHAGEDTVIAQKIKERGYKTRIVTEPTAYHFHQDPLKHHINAYERFGKSIIKRYGFRGIIKLFSLLVDINAKWIIYSFNLRCLDFRLYKFLLRLYYSFLKGGFQELTKFPAINP